MAAGLLVAALGGCSEPALSGRLAFPVGQSFVSWTGTRIYLLDLGGGPPMSCTSYLWDQAFSEVQQGPNIRIDFAQDGASEDAGGIVPPGTYVIGGVGPGSASLLYEGAVPGDGGTVILSQTGSTYVGSFETTIEGTELDGTFTAPLCPMQSP
ncbi:MAG TPA: hypothetical protein VMB50_03850 [Myxococcales bacterium]|nr:hypothetical protein [Myxococcales bacterium]